MGWQDQYRLIGIEPGRVKTSRFGLVDFADPDLPVEMVQALYESGLPYLELAPEGELRPTEEKPVKFIPMDGNNLSNNRDHHDHNKDPYR